jgi:hypothetical protein
VRDLDGRLWPLGKIYVPFTLAHLQRKYVHQWRHGLICACRTKFASTVVVKSCRYLTHFSQNAQASLLARVLPPGVQGLFKPGGSTTSDADGIVQVAGAPASASAAAAAAPSTTSAAVGRVNAAAAGNGVGVGAQGAVGAGGSEIGAKGGSGEEERARRREAWVQFFTTLDRDHVGIGILWDTTRRNELKAALDAELDILQRHRASMSGTAASSSVSLFSWNHEEFEVAYPSLVAHFCVDGVYLKAALAAGDQGATAMANLVPDVALFFTKLYRMYLEASTDAACIVYLRSMAAVRAPAKTRKTNCQPPPRARASVYFWLCVFLHLQHHHRDCFHTCDSCRA